MSTNIASSATITSSYMTTFTNMVDGNISTYVGISSALQWVKFDLGSTQYVENVKLWHYWSGGRSYHDVIVQISTDNTNWTNKFNNDADNSASQGIGSDDEYAEAEAGKNITINADARYVRFWSNGSSNNEYNHYNEVEIYVTTNITINVPVINTACEAKTPTVTYGIKVNVPAINTTCEAKIPTVTYNKRVNVPLINTNCEAKAPTVTYNIKIDVPLINISCEAKTPTVSFQNNIIINVPVINIDVAMPTPIVRISYQPIIVVSASNYFTGNRFETFEYELLSLKNERYENAGWITDYIIRDSSNVMVDFSRNVIGSANFHIRNNTDINYLVDLVRPWYVLNDTYRFPLGAYMLSSPSKTLDGKYVSRKIQGYDLLLALEQDKMINSYTIEAGTNVITAIETLLYIVGDNLWVNADITPSTEVLATDVSYELGKSKLFIINSLLNMINYYPLWADGNGVFRSIPWTPEQNITYEFIDNNLSIYTPNVGLTLDYTDIYNRVVIINNQLAQDTAPLYKVWTFENEDLGNHPFSYSSIGRYITKIFQSEAVSQDYVDLRARRELLKMLEIEEAVNYSHAYISSRENDGLPWQGDSYRFKNTKLDIDSTYKLESFQFNLKVGGLVNSKIKRIRSTY